MIRRIKPIDVSQVSVARIRPTGNYRRSSCMMVDDSPIQLVLIL
jgi:hypothetical protein